MQIKINEDNVHKRIDLFLKDELNESRSLILNNIKNGSILVNNEKVKGGYLTKLNDVIDVGDLNIIQNVDAEDIKLDILYEDNDIIVVYKPSGMVVHPGNGNSQHTLVNALKGHTDSLSNMGEETRCGIVHRIDKDTSGILLIAKTNKAHVVLAEGFKNKTIKRKYIALVHGILDTNKGKIDAPIGRHAVHRKKMCVTESNSKKAVTYFTVLERFDNATLIELELETGRTHQIRVHMDYIGHPVVNDPVYGNKKIINDYGQMLHAKYLGFNHPITNKFMEFEHKTDKEFDDIVASFRNS